MKTTFGMEARAMMIMACCKLTGADLFDANASRESTTKLEMLNVGVIRQKTSKFATAMLSISLELQPSNTHE